MYTAALMCMALNTYHEARGESFIGQVAVNEVVLNRMASETWPSTACGVIWQRKQFSWTINYKERQVDSKALLPAVTVAVNGSNYACGADHYHTIDIIPPDWADDMEVVNVIGNHIFYRSTYE